MTANSLSNQDTGAWHKRQDLVILLTAMVWQMPEPFNSEISMLRRCTTLLLALTLAGATPLMGADSIATEADAQAATAQAMANLKASDNDPQKTVAAALEFTQLLDYYKAKGDNDQVCEMQAYVYWCKKRMNLDALKVYVAAKGAPAQALAARAEEVVSTDVPKDQAEVYFARADAYAKANPKNSLTIAVRFFEVADRFTGTPVSLKAQRVSLDAMQKAALMPSSASGDLLGEDFKVPTVTAADMPEIAQKVIAVSDQLVSVITGKAGAEMGKERSKVLDVLIKEAETAQRKGDLDVMLAHQTQAKDLDQDQKGLSKSAAASMERYKKSRRSIIGKAALAVIEERKKMNRSLSSLQAEETKKGNTTGALAIKAACDKLIKGLEDASASTLAGMKEPDRPFVVKPEGGIYLGSLNPKKSEGYDIKIVKNEKDAERVVMIDNARCFEYIWAHAPSDLVFEIPSGSKQFTAYALSQSSQAVRFIVMIDGKEKFAQEPGGKNIPVNVMIPEGAKRIQIIVNTVGSSNNAAHSLWAYPYFAK